jgi:hypothetical protein
MRVILTHKAGIGAVARVTIDAIDTNAVVQARIRLQRANQIIFVTRLLPKCYSL